jgi:serine protease Do
MKGPSRGFGALVALLLVGTSACAAAQASPAAPAGPAGSSPAALLSSQGTPAQTTGSSMSVRDVAARVRPAVVQIATQQGVTQVDPLFGLEQQGVQEGIGSGIIYDQQGHILTNNHVVADATQMSVALPDGRTFDGRLVGADPATDLAVIQIQGDNLPVAQLGHSSQLAVGDGVVAIGNALGLPGGPTVTAGVVSALGRVVQEPSDDAPSGASDRSAPSRQSAQGGALLYDVIQTDAAINPGNSGGPLADMSGQVIGINTLVAAQAEPGVPAQGIGFAIAIDAAQPIAAQLVQTGHVTHPYLGVAFQWAGGASARQLRAQNTTGALVQQVQAGSPAAQAGVQRGDIITAINGQKLASETDLPATIAKQKPGDAVQLTVVRNGQSQTLSVKLAERPGTS